MKLLVLLVLAGLLAWAGHGRWWQWPDEHNPWAPLRFDAPANWLTRHKLRRLDDDRAACLAFLQTTPLRSEPVPDRTADTGGCALTNVVRVNRLGVAIGQPLLLSCRAAVSLALWERHVLQPQARAQLGSAVRSVQHLGSYACRNVYGRETGRRSQHASADAVDLAGFTLEDGRRVSVVRDWAGDGPPARFIRAVHDGACDWFDGVFGPDYNAAHADHLHLDRGPFRVCR